jgi:hypothetical protein
VTRVRWARTGGGYRYGGGWCAEVGGASVEVTGGVCGDGDWRASVACGGWECESWHATATAAKRAAVALAKALARARPPL